MAKVGKLSATKLTTYEGCSLAYFLKYVVHEKVPTNVRLLFGKHIHYMLEDFYKKNFKSAKTFQGAGRFRWYNLISGDFLKGKQKENLKVEEYHVNDNFSLKVGNHVNLGPDPITAFFAFKNLGDVILNRFYERHIKKTKPKKIEYGFGNRKDTPFSINGHQMLGFIDRIDYIPKGPNKGWYVTDYKTDKKSPIENSFVLHRHPQFTIYSYAFRHLFQEKEKSILYYHLRSGQIFKTKRSEKDYDYLKSLLDKVSEGISRDIFVPFYGFHCNFCDFQIPCEKYSIGYHRGPRIDKNKTIKVAKTFKEWDLPEWMDIDEK